MLRTSLRRLPCPSLPVLLLSWILPLTLGGILAVAWSAHRAAQGVILGDAAREVQALAGGMADSVRDYFRQRANELDIVAHSPLFRDHYMNVEYGLAEEAEVYRREIERMLTAFARKAEVYPRLRYVDARGREVVRVVDGRPRRPTREADAAAVEPLRSLPSERQHVSRTAQVDWHGFPIVRYGAALRSGDGRFKGGLLFDCSLKPVYDSLERLKVGSLRRVYLSDQRGRAELAQEPVPPGGGYLTAAAVAQGTPWSVIAVVRRSELLGGLDAIGARTFLVALFVSLFAILGTVCLVRLCTRSIRKLVDAVNAYAGGDMGTRVEVGRPEEVAALARAFNEMADRLRQRAEDLGRRIRELSALQRMNEAVLHQLGRREVGRTCLQAAVNGLGFDRGVLYWVHEDRGEIVGECAYGTEGVGFGDEDIRRRRIPLGSDDILAHVVRERRAINVADPGKDPRCNPRFVAETQSQAFCLAPIQGRDRVLGVLGVDCRHSGRPITEAMARSLSLFCSSAGLALENVELLDEIVRSEERYRTAVENSPDALVGLDQNFRVTLWNRRAEGLFGYQPMEAYGRELDFILGAADYQRLRCQIETEGAVRQADARGLTRDGRRLDLSVSWTGQKVRPGAAREWFVVLQDVTEKKLLQNQLVQAEKTAAVASMISGVAHELNNPLTGVVGFAELLRGRLRTSEDEEDMRLLHESALRCGEIVQGLLLFVRQERPILRRISLNRAVEATLALMEYRLVKTGGLALDVSLDPNLPDIAGEFQKLQQVMVNLLNNAADALKEWEGPRRLRLATEQRGDGAVLVVEDTGPGVPEELRARIFDPFVTTKPPGKGTGLGLSISAQIIGECGGRLACGAGPEGGARFTAEFPPCPPHLDASPAPACLPPPLSGRRVLVVDDEPDLVRLMLRLLREDGLEARAPGRPEEALDMLRSEDFDLAIVDIEMGGIKGTELAAAAAGLDRPPGFLFVTGDLLNPELAGRLSDLKAPCLTKPFLRTEFLRMVRRALGDPLPVRSK